MSIGKTPCYQCEDRMLGCHSTCERYKGYKEEIEEINKNRIDSVQEINYQRERCANKRRKIFKNDRNMKRLY